VLMTGGGATVDHDIPNAVDAAEAQELATEPEALQLDAEAPRNVS